MDSMKRLVVWLLEGTKGGKTRIQLIRILLKKPLNTRQLSIASGLDYKTTEHHVQLLCENYILESVGNKYGRVYFISERAQSEKEFTRIIQG